jgi:hypothetical protein
MLPRLSGLTTIVRLLATLLLLAPLAQAESRAESEPKPKRAPREANNVLYGEFLGAGILWTVNYERTVWNDLSLRVGFGALPASEGLPLIVPLTFAYHGVGNRAHSLEMGGGIDVAILTSSGYYRSTAYNPGVDVAGLLFLGYRLQPRRGGFFLRTGMNLFLSQSVYPWPYVGLGATF